MLLWEGASQIDGEPIIAVATINSDNRKTGDMVQVWILCRDIAPHLATKRGADASVCGDCPQRHYLGGACYVTLYQAPLSVWSCYQRGGYDDPKHIARVTEALRTKPLRLGAYGDPAAVPFHVWESLVAEGCKQWAGYTHQWRQPWAQAYRQLLMASCDTESEARAALEAGHKKEIRPRGVRSQ